jgi:hypothetical protein
MRSALSSLDRFFFGESAATGPGAIVLFGGVLASTTLAALAFRADRQAIGVLLCLLAFVAAKKALDALRARNL